MSVPKKLGKWSLFVAVGFSLGYGGDFGGIQKRDPHGKDVRVNTRVVRFSYIRVSGLPPYLSQQNESGEGCELQSINTSEK